MADAVHLLTTQQALAVLGRVELLICDYAHSAVRHSSGSDAHVTAGLVLELLLRHAEHSLVAPCQPLL